MATASPSRTYETNGKQITFAQIMFSWVIVLGLGCLGLEVFILLKLPEQRDPGGMLIFAALILGAGVACLWGGIFYFRRASSYRGFRVIADAAGLTVENKGKSQKLFWGRIAKVWRREHVATAQRHNKLNAKLTGNLLVCTIEAADAPRLTLHSFVEDLPGLVATIEMETCRRLLPGAKQALGKGETVAFGPVTVTADGVQAGGRSVSWNQVENDNGWLIGRLDGKAVQLIHLEDPKIPNVSVLASLLQDMRKN